MWPDDSSERSPCFGDRSAVDASRPAAQSAGVVLRKTATHRARVFAAKAGALSGTADLVAAVAGNRASYEREYSFDGGKTWTVATPTMQARTSVAGLPPVTTTQFRYRSVTPNGASDWSAPVSLIVQ